MFNWLFGKKKQPEGAPSPDKNPEGSGAPGQTLSDIVRGIAHAAQSANEIGDMATLRQFQHFFELDEKGMFIAKTARVQVGTGHYLDVPLISLIDPSTIALNEMEVKMAVRLTQTEVKEQVHAANEAMKINRASFGVSLTSSKPGVRDDVIEVVMKFKRTEPQEGVSRVIENLSNTIQPQKLTPETPPPKDFALTEQIRKQKADEKHQDLQPADSSEVDFTPTDTPPESKPPT